MTQWSIVKLKTEHTKLKVLILILASKVQDSLITEND